MVEQRKLIDFEKANAREVRQSREWSVNMAELKPCPFCGGEARHYEGSHDANGVVCKKCSAKVYGYASKGAATRAWNRRAEDGK